MNTTVLVLIIVVAVLLVAAVAFGVAWSRRRSSDRLQEQFGPEYERRVQETGDRNAAESDLRERQERRSKLDIRDLRPEERDGFQASWESIQRGFVDDPMRALQDADGLVVEIMRVRGYPVDDFDRRAEDISVDHPHVVRHYREARAVHDASPGSVDTEEQRRGLTSYRLLVEELLGSNATHRSEESQTSGHDTDRRADGSRPTTEEHTT